MDHKKPVTASVSLESRSLTAELRVTVDTEHSLYVRESLLTRLHVCAEESLLVALASVAPQLLQQAIVSIHTPRCRGVKPSSARVKMAKRMFQSTPLVAEG